MTSVGIAVVGAGLIGKQHIKAIQTCADVHVFALVDPNPQTESFAASLDVPWFPDLRSLISRARPDGLIIATPNQLHREHALEAIAAGIPTLIEKPLADTVESAHLIVEAAAEGGVPILTGHHRRHSPILQDAKNAIVSGRLGRIISAHAMCWLRKPDNYFNAEWRREPGAGPVFLNLIHDVDNLRYLLGEVTAVQALESNVTRGFAVEDSAVILLRFASGVLATVNVSDVVAAPWSWELTSGENPVYSKTEEVCYFIGGEQGALSVPRLDVWNHTTEPDWWNPIAAEKIALEATDPLINQVANFREVILGRAAPLCSGGDGLATLRVIVAIKDAARVGGTVEIQN